MTLPFRIQTALLAVVLSFAGSMPAWALQPASSNAFAFADAHVHLNDPAAWIGLMDEAGMDWSIALAGRDIGNAGLLLAAAQWPGRIRPFLSVSPEHAEFRRSWEADDETLMPVVDSLLNAGGFWGIGEISVTHFPSTGFPEADFDPNGKTMRGLFLLARKHGVPIMVHVELTRLREFETILTDFSDVTVIWAHGGYTPLFLATRLLDRHPNLIYELSARTWANHPRSPDYTILRNGREVWPEWLALIEAMPTRFVVGTDAPVRSLESDRGKIRGVGSFLDQLSMTTRRLVARQNLARILDGQGGTDLQ